MPKNNAFHNYFCKHTRTQEGSRGERSPLRGVIIPPCTYTLYGGLISKITNLRSSLYSLNSFWPSVGFSVGRSVGQSVIISERAGSCTSMLLSGHLFLTFPILKILCARLAANNNSCGVLSSWMVSWMLLSSSFAIFVWNFLFIANFWKINSQCVYWGRNLNCHIIILRKITIEIVHSIHPWAAAAP